MRWFGMLAVMAMFVGCERDKVIIGRKLMNSDPEKAINVLKEAAAERSPCFECQAYLGLAFEMTGRLSEAIAAYEAALPEAAGKPEQVPQRLLDAYEKAFEQAKTPDEKIAIARKAATLEEKLRSSRPWANRYLASEWRRAISEGKKNAAEIRKLAAEVQSLYLPLETKREVALEATEALKSLFVKQSTDAFMGSVAAELAENGIYVPEEKLIRLTNRFVIPSPKEDDSFDPESSGFKVALRKAACTPLRAKLGDIIAKVAPAIGLKPLDAKASDALFARLFQYSKAGFAAPGDDKKPAGRTWLCMIEVPLQDFFGELFRYSE